MKHKEEIDITPSTNEIESIRASRDIGPNKAVKELADNAFDAGASCFTVTTDFEGGIITFEDDGDGCDDMQHMLRRGSQAKSKRGRVGRYGVGAKDAFIWGSERTRVESATTTARMTAFVDWGAVQHSGKWSVEASFDPWNGASYTQIILHIYNRRFNSRNSNAIKDDLRETFSPGLLAGKRIIWDDEDLEAVPLPAMSEIIEREGEFQGKRWKLTAGLLPNAQQIAGYRIRIRHRVISAKVPPGHGDEYNYQRFFGYLELLEPDDSPQWILDKLKHGFDEQDELLENIFPLVQPLLKKSDEAASTIETDRLTEDLESAVNDVDISGITARKRKQSTESLPLNPVDDKKPDLRKQRLIEEVPTPKPRGNLIRVQWFDGAPRSLGFVAADKKAKVLRVTLNNNHPFLARKKKEHDVDALTPVILFLAFSLIRPGDDGQLKLWDDSTEEDTHQLARIGKALK